MTNGDRQNEVSRAGAAALLRAAVAGYLLYLGVDLIRERLLGTSTLPAAAAWLCGAAFITAGVLFGWYTWRRYRSRGDADGEPSDRNQT